MKNLYHDIVILGDEQSPRATVVNQVTEHKTRNSITNLHNVEEVRMSHVRHISPNFSQEA